jgi:hypothetical protein
VIANYEFIYVVVGKNGRMSDALVIEHTTFYQRLSKGTLNLAGNNETRENLNFVFINEVFALHNHLLKPYSKLDLEYDRRVFNYRLSRGRNVVENDFTIIASRFRILQTSINIYPSKINYSVLAICVVHNYLRNVGSSYITRTTFVRENGVTHELERGDWREESTQRLPIESLRARNAPLDAKENREN